MNATSIPAIDLAEVVRADIAGLCLYGVLMIMGVVALVNHILKENVGEKKGTTLENRKLVASVFYALVLLFSGCRLAWLATLLTFGGGTLADFALNVMSDALFFSCFSLIVLHWADKTARATYGETGTIKSKPLRYLFGGINAVLYTLQIAVIIHRGVSGITNPTLLRASVLVAVGDNVVVSLGFAIYGIRRHVRDRRKAKYGTSGSRRKGVHPLLIAMLFFACFVARSAILIVQISEGKLENNNYLARLVLIFASELIPVTFQLWVMRTRDRGQEEDSKFIADLYAQEILSGGITSEDFDPSPLSNSVGGEDGDTAANWKIN